MSYQVLARKYRPQKFSDVIGQDHVTRTLKNAIEQQRIAHGYIFSGHRGIGKTTIARILAMALNCRSTDHPVPEPCGVCDSCVEIRQGNSVDVIEIDAATNRGIDEVRELREAARYRPARDRFKIWILDEAHQITDAAFNALLKTLEEPPGHVIFMMATTEPEDIPQTIRSRCQHFSFHAVRFDEIVKQLRSIAEAEKIEADDNALALLAEAGDGSMRDALSIMDQAIATTTARLTADDVRGLVGAVSSDILEEMMEAVERNSSEEVLTLVDRLMVEGHNPTHFARQMVRFLRNSIVAKVAGKGTSLLQISQDESDRVSRVAEKFSEEDLTRFLQIMLRTHSELGYKHEQRFHLELGLLKLVHAQRLLSLEQILSNEPLPKSAPTSSPSRPAPAPARSAEPAAAPPRRPSPFESDVARRKGEPPRGSMSTAPSIEGTSAIAVAPAPDPVPQPQAQLGEVSLPKIQTATLTAMEKAGQKIIAHWLELGEWKIEGSEVIIAVAAKQPMIDAALKGEAQRVLNQSATEAVGQNVRIKVVAGANGNGNGAAIAKPIMSDGSDARSRAMKDPIVQKMKEKFGAEIRTVVDQRNKR
ncbi:MAG TPA: DNA polymerase III subunit gamma/tau [Terriglobales bacterium]|nr:DNA polymerase III subunit gamma/tau [Terriglobales bacterium]